MSVSGPSFNAAQLATSESDHESPLRAELSSYISFRGECEAAFKFYEEVLGAKPGLIFRYADSPMADVVPAGWDTKVMHGSVKIGGCLLEGADVPPDRYEEARRFYLSLHVPTAGGAWRLYEKLPPG